MVISAAVRPLHSQRRVTKQKDGTILSAKSMIIIILCGLLLGCSCDARESTLWALSFLCGRARGSQACGLTRTVAWQAAGAFGQQHQQETAVTFDSL